MSRKRSSTLLTPQQIVSNTTHMTRDQPLRLAKWMKSIMLCTRHTPSTGAVGVANHAPQLASHMFTALHQVNSCVFSYSGSPLTSATILLPTFIPTTHLRITSTLLNSLFLFFLSNSHTHIKATSLQATCTSLQVRVFFFIMEEGLGFLETMVLHHL